MPTFEQAVKNHMDNIAKALESKNAEKALKALYEFGSMLQMQHPDKDYVAIQKLLEKSYKKKYEDYPLSDKAIAQAGALFEMISVYYIDHATQDEEKKKQGDLSIFMINNALKSAILCFGCLMPDYEKRLDNLVSSTDSLATLQSTQVNRWIDKTISTVDLSRKYNLGYLEQLCEKIQQQLLKEIGPVSIVETFSASDREKSPQIAIAIDQYKKIEELHRLLKDPKRLPHERLCDFIGVYNEDATQKLLNKSSLGKNFKEKISNLFNVLSEKGIYAAYGMWKQHKALHQALHEVKIEVGAIKGPSKPSG